MILPRFAWIPRCGGSLIVQQCRLRHSDSGSSKHSKSHYEVLGIRQDASQSAVKDAFVEMSKRLHPDHHPSRPDLHRRFVLVSEAYRVLSRPALRRQYDEALHDRTVQGRGGAAAGVRGRGAARGPVSSSADESFHWRDESLHDMRDKTKDNGRYYSSDSFYGIKGVTRLSNHVIALWLLVFAVAGSLTIFVVSAQTNRWRQHRLDERNKANGMIYRDVRRRALLQENEVQKLLVEHQKGSTSPERLSRGLNIDPAPLEDVDAKS